MARIPLFEDYFISEKTGFVLEEPQEELPEYFSAWHQVGRNVASLLEQHKLRDAVDKMPLLEACRLRGHRERRLAYMLLSFMGSGYVWQDGDAGMPKKLPRQLSVPWWRVADSLGMKPVITHAGLVLGNCKIVGPNRELQTVCQMPGGVHGDYFILHTAQIELHGVRGLSAILECMRCMTSADEKGMMAALETVNDSLLEMTSTLNQLSQQMDPNVFFNQMRPFFSGWGGETSPLPEGLIYEGVSDEPMQMRGGSGGQSPIIQSFDAAFGSSHEPDKQVFLDDMRAYMMPRHRAFVEALRQAPSISNENRQQQLLAAYSQCLDAFRTFRTCHIQIAARFVVTMSHKWMDQDKRKALSALGTGAQGRTLDGDWCSTRHINSHVRFSPRHSTSLAADADAMMTFLRTIRDTTNV